MVNLRKIILVVLMVLTCNYVGASKRDRSNSQQGYFKHMFSHSKKCLEETVKCSICCVKELTGFWDDESDSDDDSDDLDFSLLKRKDQNSFRLYGDVFSNNFYLSPEQRSKIERIYNKPEQPSKKRFDYDEDYFEHDDIEVQLVETVNDNWGSRAIERDYCHEQEGLECAFMAVLHALEEFRKKTYPQETIKRFLRAWAESLKRDRNLEPNEIQKLLNIVFPKRRERERVCVVCNIDEAKNLSLVQEFDLITERIKQLTKHFLDGKKVIILLQTRKEAELENEEERRRIGHWVMLSVQRTDESHFSMTMKNSLDPYCEFQVNPVAKEGIQHMYDYFENQLFESNLFKSNSKNRF